MPDESSRTRIVRLVTRTARWRPRSDRQIWLIVAALEIVFCAEAIAIPAKRAHLLYGVLAFILLGIFASRGRRQREALAARVAAVSRDDIPADVIGLVATGKKVQAMRRYRELTAVSLREAKAVIDSL